MPTVYLPDVDKTLEFPDSMSPAQANAAAMQNPIVVAARQKIKDRNTAGDERLKKLKYEAAHKDEIEAAQNKAGEEAVQKAYESQYTRPFQPDTKGVVHINVDKQGRDTNPANAPGYQTREERIHRAEEAHPTGPAALAQTINDIPDTSLVNRVPKLAKDLYKASPIMLAAGVGTGIVAEAVGGIVKSIPAIAKYAPAAAKLVHAAWFAPMAVEVKKDLHDAPAWKRNPDGQLMQTMVHAGFAALALKVGSPEAAKIGEKNVAALLEKDPELAQAAAEIVASQDKELADKVGGAKGLVKHMKEAMAKQAKTPEPPKTSPEALAKAKEVMAKAKAPKPEPKPEEKVNAPEKVVQQKGGKPEHQGDGRSRPPAKAGRSSRPSKPAEGVPVKAEEVKPPTKPAETPKPVKAKEVPEKPKPEPPVNVEPKKPVLEEPPNIRGKMKIQQEGKPDINVAYTDKGPMLHEPPAKPVVKRAPKNAGFVNMGAFVDPVINAVKKGAKNWKDATHGGRYGHILRAAGNSESAKEFVASIYNRHNAATTGQLIGRNMTRPVLEGLSESEKADFGKLTKHLNLALVDPTHSDLLTPAEVARIDANPKITAALAIHIADVAPTLRVMKEATDDKFTANEERDPIYRRLYAETDSHGNPIKPGQNGAGGGNLGRFRLKRRLKSGLTATGGGTTYSNDYEQSVIRDVKEIVKNGADTQLYETLKTLKDDRGQKLVYHARTKVIPPVVIDGKVQEMQRVTFPSKGGHTQSYIMPKGIADTFEEVVKGPRRNPAEQGLHTYALEPYQRLTTTFALLSHKELVGRFLSQMWVVSKTAPYASAKSMDILGDVFAGPTAGLSNKAVVLYRMLTDDVSTPEGQQRLENMTRSGLGNTDWADFLGKETPVIGPAQHYMHDLIFGMPEGASTLRKPLQGFKGFDLRWRYQLEKLREMAEGHKDPATGRWIPDTNNPQRTREFSEQLGMNNKWTPKLMEWIKNVNRFAGSAVLRKGTSARRMLGDSGYDLSKLTVGQQQAVRAWTLYRAYAAPALAFIWANKMASGHWPWQNKPGNELKIEGHDKDGKPITIDALAIVGEHNMQTGLEAMGFSPRVLGDLSRGNWQEAQYDWKTDIANQGLDVVKAPGQTDAAAFLTNLNLYLNPDRSMSKIVKTKKGLHGEEKYEAENQAGRAALIEQFTPLIKSAAKKMLPGVVKNLRADDEYDAKAPLYKMIQDAEFIYPYQIIKEDKAKFPSSGRRTSDNPRAELRSERRKPRMR